MTYQLWRGGRMLLIVERERESLQALLAAAASFRRDVATARSARDALNLLEQSQAVDVAVIAAELPDGTGLDVVQRIRERWPTARALVLARSDCHQICARAQRLGAQYLRWPWEQEDVQAFLMNKLAPALERRLASHCQQNGFSTKQAMVLRHAIAGTPRAVIARRLGVSENTIKTQVRRLLARCSSQSLADVVAAVMCCE